MSTDPPCKGLLSDFLHNTRPLDVIRQSVIALSLFFSSLTYSLFSFLHTFPSPFPPPLIHFPPSSLLLPPSSLLLPSSLPPPLLSPPYIQQADVLHVYFERVWQLLPNRFRYVLREFSEHEVIITAASSLCSSLPFPSSVFDFLGVLRVARAQHKDTPPILVPQGSPALTVCHISSTL